MRRSLIMTRSSAALCVCLLALAGPAAADALDDIPGLKIVTYPVFGTDGASLRRSIISQRRTDPKTGEASDAQTRWKIGWSVSYDSNGGCDLGQVLVDFSLEVTLPELVGPQRLPADVLQRWNAYLAALRRHEAGHARHAYEGVDAIREAVIHGDCAHANDRGREVVQRLSQFDIDYDRETQHGVRQGSILP